MIKQILFVLLFSISIISACDDGQININTASATELDSLYGIGPVKADAIISKRPFSSIDDLLEVYGIGEATLIKIKSQGLACVESDGEPREKEEENKIEDEKIINNKSANKPVNEESNYNLAGLNYETQKEINLEPIILNPKHIKTNIDKENLDKSNYGIYSLIAFSVLLGVLFIFKNNKKTEFR